MEKSTHNDIVQSTCHFTARWKILKKGDKLKGSKLQLENGRVIESNFRVGKLEGDGEGVQRGSVFERCWYGVSTSNSSAVDAAAPTAKSTPPSTSKGSKKDTPVADLSKEPYLSEVSFEVLDQYPQSELSIANYYDQYEEDCKPITLIDHNSPHQKRLEMKVTYPQSSTETKQICTTKRKLSQPPGMQSPIYRRNAFVVQY